MFAIHSRTDFIGTDVCPGAIIAQDDTLTAMPLRDSALADKVNLVSGPKVTGGQNASAGRWVNEASNWNRFGASQHHPQNTKLPPLSMTSLTPWPSKAFLLHSVLLINFATRCVSAKCRVNRDVASNVASFPNRFVASPSTHLRRYVRRLSGFSSAQFCIASRQLPGNVR
jgi:hypothetical protein